jgi:hypothetical protein
MKVFREFFIYLPVAKTEMFFNEVEKNLDARWSREHELEAKLSRGVGGEYRFSYDNKEELEAASIAFIRKNDEIVYISCLNPGKYGYGKIWIDQHNAILSECYEKCLLPICKKHSIHIERTSDNQDMIDWISEDTYKKLKCFLKAANNSAPGSAYHFGQDPWFSFILSVINNKEDIDPGLFENWLIEDKGWRQNIASNLTIEFEKSIALLEYFKEN